MGGTWIQIDNRINIGTIVKGFKQFCYLTSNSEAALVARVTDMLNTCVHRIYFESHFGEVIVR